MALFAQNPGNRIDNVRFATSVWTHDAGQSSTAKGQVRFLAKGFEANQFDFTQFEQETPYLPPRVMQ